MKNIQNRTLFACGKFDYSGGKQSKLAKIIFDSANLADANTTFVNGGYFEELEDLVETVKNYETVYWLAESTGNLSKHIKEVNPKLLLVGSKRNMDEENSFLNLVARTLLHKDNLLVEFSNNSNKDNRYLARVLDPLGNVFLDRTPDFSLVGKVLAKRVAELKTYTRVESVSVGEYSLEQASAVSEHFLDIIKHSAETFTSLIRNSDGARFLGNASFRCENGFPSFRNGNLVYVSRRNIDKRGITKDNFVPVLNTLVFPVKYFGASKPSVDTPVQLLLYNNYQNVNYMLHGHVYIKDAPFTNETIPCGALEEASEIMKIVPHNSAANISVNLKGHGSIVLAHDPDYFSKVEYFARPIPEVHDKYVDVVQGGKNETKWK